MDFEITNTMEEVPIDLLLLADPSEEMIDEYIRTGITFLAKHHSEIVGVLVLLKTRPYTMEIMNIAVYEKYQNKGVGKRLIMKAIEYAKNCMMKTLEIGTGNPGIIQIMLYQKCGFRITGVELDHFRKHYKEKIFENGIECRDMIRMRIEF